jgi:hypothetical protein
MTVLVACDLDRTLIYSRKAAQLGEGSVDLVCAEVHNGEQASFMTAAAAKQLGHVVEASTFVPVTTRVLEQYRRVVLPGAPPQYAIAANGGVLLIDGVEDRSWTDQVAATLADGVPLAEVWQHVALVCYPEFTIKVRNAADLFCYAVVHPHKLPSGFLDHVGGWAAERGWRVSMQGRKLYWMPASLTKSAAVAEVARRIAATRVLAAGDSLLDVDMLLAADLGIHPRHGELYEQGWSAPTVACTESTGTRAGEEIVAWFATELSAVTR